MTETTRRLSAEADGGSKGEPRRLIVLRHGQTASNLKGIWQGHLDHELTDLGREQAAAAARAIASLRPTRIVSSDLSRAHDTALAVAAASGDLDVAVDERWREIHAGAWQGLTAAEVGEHGFDAYASLNRTCELGMTEATGRPYRHVLQHLEAATR